jgi:hypothetical protein
LRLRDGSASPETLILVNPHGVGQIRMWVGTLSLVILSLGMIGIGVELLLTGYIYWGVVLIASPAIPTYLHSPDDRPCS